MSDKKIETLSFTSLLFDWNQEKQLLALSSCHFDNFSRNKLFNSTPLIKSQSSAVRCRTDNNCKFD